MSTILDPTLDLTLTRETSLPREAVWRALTEPELLKQWFCPKPWSVAECDLELWPGGRFYTVMQSPEGDQFPGEGCVLEVVENTILVWASHLLPGFRPKTPEPEAFPFTAIIQLDSIEGGTRYSATLLHADAAGREKHAAMGFESGWGAAFDQLVELMTAAE